MSLELGGIYLKEPDYYYRKYENDIVKKEFKKTYLDQFLRIGNIALPFLSLYKPLNYPLSIGLNAFRVVTDISQLRAIYQSDNRKDKVLQVLKLAVNITLLGLAVFTPPIGMLVTTVQNLINEIGNLQRNIKTGDYQNAIENCFNIINNSLYLALFFVGGAELTIVSLAIQILLGIYNTNLEISKGNYLEASGHVLMAFFRCTQIFEQVKILQTKWKIQELHETKINQELQKQREEINNIRKEIEGLRKQKIEESETYKNKFEELNKQLLECQEVEQILIKYGNNPELITPLHFAIKTGDDNAVKIMLKYGIDINLMDRGYTPLHRAIESNRKETVDLLIRHGANVNARNAKGYTPLHEAITTNQFEMVTFLLQNGADATAKVQKGLAEFRCLDLARQSGSSDLSMLFIDKDILILEERCRQHFIEADVKKSDPIELAFQKSDLELVQHLFQTRERDLFLEKQTFKFPGYEFFRSFIQGSYSIWEKPMPVKIKGGNGIYIDMLNRVDTESIKVLMKYDSANSWKKYIPEWLSRSYHLGDLETIKFLIPLAKKANINTVFHQGEQRYLIDPFLSDTPIDRENSSHFYIPNVGPKPKTPPSLFEYRSDDNARTRELKSQIQELLNPV